MRLTRRAVLVAGLCEAQSEINVVFGRRPVDLR